MDWAIGIVVGRVVGRVLVRMSDAVLDYLESEGVGKETMHYHNDKDIGEGWELVEKDVKRDVRPLWPSMCLLDVTRDPRAIGGNLRTGSSTGRVGELESNGRGTGRCECASVSNNVGVGVIHRTSQEELEAHGDLSSTSADHYGSQEARAGS